MAPQTVLVTGGAGFIGSHLSEALIQKGHKVVCIDDFNDYYDPAIKRKNIQSLLKKEAFTLIEADIRDTKALETTFNTHPINTIIHLAARAGVRPSLQQPRLYTEVNITGTLNLLEEARKHNIKRFLFASSSSVYGDNEKVPFSEDDVVDYPVSPYAATKKAGELLCYNYYHLHQIECACLRFFTVYGPKQRPEMAIHMFTRMIEEGKELPVYNEGKNLRDYTYIDDIIQGILNIFEHPNIGYDIINLGESATISTIGMIHLIEEALGKKANVKLLPAQPGDVFQTYADITHAKTKYQYNPQYPIQKGIQNFVEWYKNNR